MKFVFHPAYDSELPVKARSIADGSKPEAELGVVYGGRTALLRVLEQHLGIVTKEPSSLARSIQFLNLLEDRCKTEKPFYAECLKVDPIGTASTFLSWRDQLVLANWSGAVDTKSSSRLKEHSFLNSLALVIAPGPADRFAEVWESLQSHSLDFLQIKSKTPLSKVRDFPGRILKKIGAKVTRQDSAKSVAREASSLHRIQLSLSADDKFSDSIRNPDFKTMAA